jgi:hypothetical protein
MINYQSLSDALRYYKELGYTEMDVPWDIPYEDMMITCSNFINIVQGKWGKNYYQMIGSAEQSFIHLDKLGKLQKNKKYVACTPSYNDLNNEIKIVKTNIGYDLELNNIELGSYGVRKYGQLHWVYGTGLAEPRFSKVCEII